MDFRIPHEVNVRMDIGHWCEECRSLSMPYSFFNSLQEAIPGLTNEDLVKGVSAAAANCGWRVDEMHLFSDAQWDELAPGGACPHNARLLAIPAGRREFYHVD